MWTGLPHIVEIGRLLADGALCDIVTVMADHGQFFPKDPASRLFARELGGGVLLDCGDLPCRSRRWFSGKRSGRGLDHPGIHGVDGQTSMLFGISPSGAQAVLTCTSSARTPTRAAIVGTEAASRSTASFTHLPPSR